MNIGFFALKFGTGYLIGGFCLIAIETTAICISKAVYEKRKRNLSRRQIIRRGIDNLACADEADSPEKTDLIN